MLRMILSIYIGNGVSELIVMAMQGLLNEADEMLIPAPDYPLWTAATSLSGGTPVHYRCDEDNGWQPDLEDMAAKITDRTRGIVVINPNNPTGAVYDQTTLEAIIELARQRNLIIFADERCKVAAKCTTLHLFNGHSIPKTGSCGLFRWGTGCQILFLGDGDMDTCATRSDRTYSSVVLRR